MNAADYHSFTRELLEKVQADKRVVGLVAVGSMSEIDGAPDEWSDHDFFLIVNSGEQESFRSDLSWLPQNSSIVFSFRETAHGMKVIYSDGHLAEFAVFDRDEVRLAGVNRFRILLDRADLQQVIAEVASQKRRRDTDIYLAGQFICNLLVACLRWKRGERLSARTFLLAYAVPNLVRLIVRYVPASNKEAMPDTFDPLRRMEFRYPSLGAEINSCFDVNFLEGASMLLDIAQRELPDHFSSDAITAVRKVVIMETAKEGVDRWPSR